MCFWNFELSLLMKELLFIYYIKTKTLVFFKFWIVSCIFHGLQLNREHCYKKLQGSIQEDSEMIRLNAHNLILCMNSKDLSEEIKDALKYTVLCNYSIKNLCGAVLQSREFLFGKPNSSTQNKCSIAWRTIQQSLQGRINRSSTHKTCSAYTELPASYNLCEHMIEDHPYAHALPMKAFIKKFLPDQLADKSNIKARIPKLNLK